MMAKIKNFEMMVSSIKCKQFTGHSHNKAGVLSKVLHWETLAKTLFTQGRSTDLQ